MVISGFSVLFAAVSAVGVWGLKLFWRMNNPPPIMRIHIRTRYLFIGVGV